MGRKTVSDKTVLISMLEFLDNGFNSDLFSRSYYLQEREKLVTAIHEASDELPPSDEDLYKANEKWVAEQHAIEREQERVWKLRQKYGDTISFVTSPEESLIQKTEEEVEYEWELEENTRYELKNTPKKVKKKKKDIDPIIKTSKDYKNFEKIIRLEEKIKKNEESIVYYKKQLLEKKLSSKAYTAIYTKFNGANTGFKKQLKRLRS